MIIFLWISVALVRYCCFGLHVMLKNLNYSKIIFLTSLSIASGGHMFREGSCFVRSTFHRVLMRKY